MPLSPSVVTPGDTELDDPVRNPWVESKDFAPHTAKDQATQLYESDTRSVDVQSSQVRSHTIAGHPLHASPDPTYGAIAHGSSLDLHETRPSLRRVIDASIPDATGTESNERTTQNGSGKQREVDAEVIVHQVQSTDSLPGVALKYNISVAMLRCANKLWANDSIHLRQVLYIPVHAVTTQTPQTAATDAGIRPNPLYHRSTPETRTHHTSSIKRREVSEGSTIANEPETINHTSAARTIAASNNSIIKRVPLSELSFFPPPSASMSAHSSLTDTCIVNPPISSTLRPNSSRSITLHSTLPRGWPRPQSPFAPETSGASTNGPPSLRITSFFAGAKEEIISRLSFDSVRGSSDTAEDAELEMDIVRPITASDRRKHDKTHDIVSWQCETTPLVEQRNSGTLNKARKSKPQEVRTVQLQPSLRMEIPALLENDISGNE